MTTRITFLIGLTLLAVLVIAVPLSAQSQTITTFDAPGAGTGGYQGTNASAINPAGTITGYYTDANYVTYGFVRSEDGSFTTFAAPGAAGTLPAGINPAGTIMGSYFGAGYVTYGFVRTAHGTITAKVAPPDSISMNPVSISPDGTIAGSYQDGNTGAWRCFVRSKAGVYTTFDIPNAVGFIFSAHLNQGGAVTGTYTDANAVLHAFLRRANGTLISFDAPGAGTGVFQGTSANSINPTGTITGTYTDANSVSHGFVRAADGTITSFDAPGAGTASYTGTNPNAINPDGVISGSYSDANSVSHGFVRSN